jgi:hypothetical protein
MNTDIITQTDKYGNYLSSAAPQMMKTEADRPKSQYLGGNFTRL